MELATYILKSSGVLFLFYAVYFLWLRRDTLFKAKRQFLLLGLLLSLILPIVQFTKMVIVEIQESQGNGEEITSATTLLPQNATELTFTLLDVFWIIYSMGVAFMIFRFLKAIFSIIRILISTKPNKKDGLYHVQTNYKHAPFSFLKYIVYNPSIHSEEELQMIIKHEKVHAYQWHSVDILLANIILIFQWINPFAWLFKKSIEENLEFIADNETVQQISSKKAYQLALVKASSSYALPALTNNFYQSFIKKRIIMLNKSHSKKVNVLKIGIILPLLALFLWSFNVKEVVSYKIVPTPEIITEAPSEKLSEEPPKIENSNTISETAKKSEEKPEIVTSAITKPIQKTTEKNNISIESRGKFSVKITKHTTNDELEKIKKTLKSEYQIDMSYTVVRNDANEIISLSMQYSGTGDDAGRNGNYQINDDEGIEPFHFIIDEEGISRFYSEAAEARKVERLKERNVKLKERKEKMKERKVKMKENEIARRAEMAMRKEALDKRRVAVVSSTNSNDDSYSFSIAQTGEGTNAAIVSNSADVIIIDKNTTDAELEKIKKELARKDIEFIYKNVKRNDANEITGIKLTVKNNGSKTLTNIKSDDDEPIDQIIINQ